MSAQCNIDIYWHAWSSINKHLALFWKITPADDTQTRRYNNATHLPKLFLAAMAESQNHSDLGNAWLLGSVAYP